jgi:hypothetical protein
MPCSQLHLHLPALTRATCEDIERQCLYKMQYRPLTASRASFEAVMQQARQLLPADAEEEGWIEPDYLYTASSVEDFIIELACGD